MRYCVAPCPPSRWALCLAQRPCFDFSAWASLVLVRLVPTDLTRKGQARGRSKQIRHGTEGGQQQQQLDIIASCAHIGIILRWPTRRSARASTGRSSCSPVPAGRHSMPPATTAGAAEGKAGAGKKKKRKSLAVDANLLGSGGSGSESDGRRSRPAAASTRGGAGDPGGEDESSNRRIEQRQKDAQSRKPDSQDGQKRAKTKTQVRKAAATGDSGSPSPPTKTMTTTTRPATERERDSTEARPRSKSKAIADDAPKVVPSKRKGRPESSQPTSASIHPTPPLTDPPHEAADAEGAPQQRQRRKGDAETSKSSQAVEGTDGSLQNGKAKKTKTAKVAAAREEVGVTASPGYLWGVCSS